MKKEIRLSLILLFCIFAVTLSAQPARGDSIVRVGACATPGITWGVFVQDSFAYVADRNATTVVSISITSSPFVVSSLNVFSASALGLFIEDTLCYNNFTAIGNRFSVLCVSHPDSLYVLGWCDVPGTGGPDPTGIYTIDTISYLANGVYGLGIINVDEPSSPYTVSYFNTPGWALDLSVADTLVFIADYDSIVIVNVRDLLNPFRVAAVAMPNGCYGISVVDTLAFVACISNSGTNGSLQVVNVSNPSSPQIVASVDNLKGDPIDIWVSGNYAYVAAADYWNPPKRKPRQVGGLRPDWTFNRRADVEGGLRVVDIAEPLNPTLVASYDTPGDPRGVFAVDTLVFVADYDSLQILKHIVTGLEEQSNEESSREIRLQVYPNPFSYTTSVFYNLPVATSVNLEIFDISGRHIKTLYSGYNNAGEYNILWNRKGTDENPIVSGIYFLCMTTKSDILVKRILVLK